LGLVYIKKGSPVHIAPACAGSGEGSDHFGSYAYLQQISNVLCL
jgi:hypothetical protein